MMPADEWDIYRLEKYRNSRYFAVWEHPEPLLFEESPPEPRLVCVTVYKRGAAEIVKRLNDAMHEDLAQRNRTEREENRAEGAA
jgi:hypothetical protein